MKMNKLLLSLVVVFAFAFSQVGRAQQTVTYDVAFSSGPQNMWGPSFSAFSIDTTISIFNLPWSQNVDIDAVVTVAGQDFGGRLNGGFSGLFGAQMSLEGFTLGEVEVDYPIDILLDMPNDLSYDQGDSILIQTSYTVDPAYELETRYPSIGEAKLDFLFQLAGGLSADLCFFGCTSFPIIPNFNTGLVTINVITANIDGVWFLGPGSLPPYVGGNNTNPNYPGTWESVGGIFPYAVDPEMSPQGTPPTANWIPWQCHVPTPEVTVPDNPAGLSGQIGVPSVSTTDGLYGANGLGLGACGEDTYLNLNLEVFKLLSNFIPGPVGVVIGNLSGEQELGLATVKWNIFSASFDMNVHNKQCFVFTPTVWGRYEFPVAVDYRILDAGTSTYSAVQTSSIIDVELGDDLEIKFPCYFESMDVTPTYFIDGTADNFRNHTYDSVSFDFLMSALEFGLEVPGVTVVPGFTIPEVCVTIGYPCGWFDWCTSQICTPEIVVPPIGLQPIDLSWGPLWSTSIPLGSFNYDWVDISWNLEGFSPVTVNDFTIRAAQLGITNDTTDVSCYGGSDGAIDVTTVAVTPDVPYTYTWTNGATTEDITGLTAGSYQLSVIDQNGCQMYTGALIEQPLQPLTIQYTAVDVLCNGNSTGSITLSVTGGTGAYSYLWSTGATGSSITGLTAGTYSVTVTDIRGCVASLTVEITEPNALGIVGAVTDVDCFGNNNGEIDVDVFGGVGPYTYLWSNSASTQDLNGVIAGAYTLTVTDVNMCVASATYTINQPAAPLNVTAVGTNLTCFQQGDGAIDATVTGGTAPYSYQWTGSSGFVMAASTEDLTGLAAGDYILLVTDANGCQASVSQTLSEPTLIVDDAAITNVLCFGSATGVIDPQISGGVGGYSYAWSNGGTAAVLTGLTAGVYDLTVTDLNGCSQTFSYTVTEPASFPSATAQTTDIGCFGESTGVIDVTTVGGTPGYTFAWSNGATTEDLNGVPSGAYSVTITDANGCSFIENYTLNQPAAPLALSSVGVDILCHGDSTGQVDLTVTGGTAPYTQLWSTQDSIVMIETGVQLVTIPAGTYTVLVTDDNGCQSTLTTVINEPAEPIALTSVATDALCFGSTDGTIDVGVSGGTPGYTYAWSNGATTEDIIDGAGTYTLVVTDFNGCTEQISDSIGQPVAPVQITTIIEDVLCFGQSTGGIESFVQGGTAPYSWAWSNGATTEEIDQLPAGVYTLTVTDDNGCTAFTGSVVGQPAAPLAFTTTITDASCYGYEDGQIVLDITGGTMPYYFSWGSQNDILLNNPSETLSDLPASDYFIRVTDEHGCETSSTITVGEPTIVTHETTVADALCYDEASGSIDLEVTGGTAPWTFTWSNGATTEDNINILAGRYDYVATDANGCEYSGFATVGQPDSMDVYAQVFEVTCIDQEDGAFYITTYGGTAPYSFDWSNGSTSQNIENLAPGVYVVDITDANGCEQTFDFELFETLEECLFIPNTITINGDNYNDTWIIRNIELYPNALVKVFNKWGNEVFSSEGIYEPWDGTYNGEPLPSEVYYYLIRLDNQAENEYTGTLTIIR